MRVIVLGLRGFPDVQGGVETHAQHLYPLLAKLGCEVDVIVRSPYADPELDYWKKVHFHRLWSPRSSGAEAFVHTFIGVLYAGLKRPDVLHIHAIGPAIMTPLARLLGLRVVVTHHGPDYDREKWGAFARWVLRTGELLGMRYASQRIVISRVIDNMVREKYRQKSNIIPNGVVLPSMPDSNKTLQCFSLTAGKYILLISRMVPEKRHLDLISAFEIAKPAGWKLVLVGDTSGRDKYVQTVLDVAQDTADVVVTGFQCGSDLQELYAGAGLFVLPSSHEGLPIAMLEALSYGLPVLASDIPANLEVDLPTGQYFPLGEITVLAERIDEFTRKEFDQEYRDRLREGIAAKYCWQKIADDTYEVYEAAQNP